MKKIFLTFSTLIIFFSHFSYGVALADDLDLPVQSAIAVEADTGKILYEKDSDKVRDIGGLPPI